MYLEFFRRRPDVASVVHCHPPCCGAWAVAGGDNLLMRPVYPEVCLEIGPVPLVPYATPLTKELGERFVPFLPKYNAFLMENHGLVILSGRELAWTCHLVEELEVAADSLLRAAAVGDVRQLSRGQLDEMDAIMDIRKLPRCGAPGVNPTLAALYFPPKE